MAAHLSALVAVVGLPFGHVVGPLVVYLVKHEESEFVGEHARSSLNYQITVSIAAIVAVVVGIVLFAIAIAMLGLGSSQHGSGMSDAAGVGIIALWVGIILVVAALLIVSLVFIIMGTMAAGAGKPYTYPFAIKFVR